MRFAAMMVPVAALGLAGCGAGNPVGSIESVVAANGDPHVPSDYRTKYEQLGSWVVASDPKDPATKEMHLVYASPGTIAAYRKDHVFPDGTVLVKEVYDKVTTAVMTTGFVTHPQGLKGWFVMVKDSKGTHPGKKLWGDGWGWSWFDAANPMKTTSTDYKTDCQACHVPAKATDWIYTQGYPALAK